MYTVTAFLPSPPGGLTLLSCVDDLGGPLARLQFAAKANTTYYIQAGGAAGATGLLQIAIDCTPACPPQSDTSGGQGGGCCTGPDTGNVSVPAAAPGIVTAPDTGSGGYLPGARR